MSNTEGYGDDFQVHITEAKPFINAEAFKHLQLEHSRLNWPGTEMLLYNKIGDQPKRLQITFGVPLSGVDYQDHVYALPDAIADLQAYTVKANGHTNGFVLHVGYHAWLTLNILKSFNKESEDSGSINGIKVYRDDSFEPNAIVYLQDTPVASPIKPTIDDDYSIELGPLKGELVLSQLLVSNGQLHADPLTAPYVGGFWDTKQERFYSFHESDLDKAIDSLYRFRELLINKNPSTRGYVTAGHKILKALDGLDAPDVYPLTYQGEVIEEKDPVEEGLTRVHEYSLDQANIEHLRTNGITRDECTDCRIANEDWIGKREARAENNPNEQ